MQTFQRLEPDVLDRVRPYLQDTKSRICNHTPVYTLFWRDYLRTEYALHGGALFLRSLLPGGTVAFSPPLGGSPAENLSFVARHCREQGIPLRFFNAPVLFVEQLRSLLSAFHAEPRRDFYDYVYNAEDLADFRGKRYAGQRNHCNRFEKLCPRWRHEALTEEKAPVALRFLEHWTPRNGGTRTAEEELEKSRELLRHFGQYRLTGCLLFAEEGRLAAFSMGERVGDTYFVHVEKADEAFHGAHQMIVREGARRVFADGASFINRGEDDGVEGLRTSKLSYHPAMLLEKYDITVTDSDNG